MAPLSSKMERKGRQTRRIATIVMAASALVAAGCGKEQSFSNDPRPPSTIVLSATITAEKVSVFPRRLGAGPVRLVVANQTSAAQSITFETAGSAAGFSQQTGPLNPGDTATLRADLPPGKVTVKVQGDGIDPALVTVGARRGSAQNELLQP